jgi:SAM-dependent methyltransferase
MTHQGLNMVTEGHVGGNIVEGDPHSFSPNAWNYVLERFAIRSVLDIGAGRGHAAHYFHRAGMQVLAIDGMEENCKKSHYPVLHLDLTKTSAKCSVDLVICVEVVEHIEEQYLDNLLSSLCCGRIIYMTNALVGQGGYHHVNEQPTEYWAQHLAKRGCVVSVDDTNRVRELAADDKAYHIARTGLVLVNNNWGN